MNDSVTSFFETDQEGRTSGTALRYEEAIRALANAIEKEGVAVTPAAIVEHFIGKATAMSHGYWSVVNAAVKNLIKRECPYPENMRLLAKLDAADRPSRWVRRPPGLLPPTRFRIETSLRSNTRSRYDPLLIALIRAGVATGLRPTEWVGTEFVSIDGRDWLSVRVKKTKREQAPLRHLGIHTFPEEDLEMVRTVAAAAHEIGEDWEEAVRACSRLFKATIDKLEIPGEPRLYWTRHQFAANAKSVLPLKAVSALMGHLATATTNQYAGAECSEIGLVYPPEIHRIVAVPDYLPDEAERVVDSSKVGGRSGKGAVRHMLEPRPSSFA